MKIIHIIAGTPFTHYLSEAFCIDRCKKQGIDVEIWDFTPIIRPTMKYDHHTNINEIIIFSSKKNLIQKIKENKNAVFVTAINFEFRFFFIYHNLAKFKCKHIKIANGWIRQYGISRFQIIASLRAFCKKTILTFLNNIKVISLPQYVFIPGTYWNDKLAGNPILFNMNHLNYDEVLIALHHPRKQIMQKPYILFLDEAYASHPDDIFLDTSLSTRQIEEYFRKMQYVFSLFEERFNLPIVIAAHPKSNYIGNEFGEGKYGKRQILKHQTIQLSLDAEIFLSHFCTTRLIALMLKKPLYCIYLNIFEEHPCKLIQSDIKYFTKESGTCPVKEKENFFIKDFIPNEAKYNTYLNKYYTSKETENTYTLDIIAQKLVELCNEKN